MSLITNINSDDLSQTELAIYNFIMINLEKIPYMRVREVAQASHTSSASVMRFIHKVGFDSFPAFRSEIKRRYNQAADRKFEGDFYGNILQLLQIDQFSADMERNMPLLANKILESENIVFIGIGLSGIMAEYAARRIMTLGVNCFAVTDPYYPLANRLKNTSDNLFIAISNSGNSTDIVELLTYFQAFPDHELVSILGNIDSPLARMSRMVFLHSYEEHRKLGYFDTSSQLPTMLIIERLIAELEIKLDF